MTIKTLARILTAASMIFAGGAFADDGPIELDTVIWEESALGWLADIDPNDTAAPSYAEVEATSIDIDEFETLLVLSDVAEAFTQAHWVMHEHRWQCQYGVNEQGETKTQQEKLDCVAKINEALATEFPDEISLAAVEFLFDLVGARGLPAAKDFVY